MKNIEDYMGELMKRTENINEFNNSYDSEKVANSCKRHVELKNNPR